MAFLGAVLVLKTTRRGLSVQYCRFRSDKHPYTRGRDFAWMQPRGMLVLRPTGCVGYIRHDDRVASPSSWGKVSIQNVQYNLLLC